MCGVRGIWVIRYPMSRIVHYTVHNTREMSLQAGGSTYLCSGSVWFHSMAAVYLAPSRPSDTHRVANWVTVLLPGTGRQTMAKMAAPGSRPEREDQLGLGLPLCVCQAQLLHLDLGSTRLMSMGGEAGPRVCRPGPPLCQGEFGGEGAGSEHKGHCSAEQPSPGTASAGDGAKREAPARRTGQISLPYLWCCGL